MQDRTNKIKTNPSCKTRLTHNIIWKKWQHCKSIYEQQRIQQNSRAELSRRKIEQIQRGDLRDSCNSIKEYESGQNLVKSRDRASYQEFVRKVGNNVVVLGAQWIKIGQLHAYCINYPKRRASKIVNTEPNPQQIKNIRKSLKSRNCRSNWNRVKTQPVPQLTSHLSLHDQFTSYQIASQPYKKSKTVSSQQFMVGKQTINSNHGTSKHTKSMSKSSCRPWSKFEKDSEKDKDLM